MRLIMKIPDVFNLKEDEVRIAALVKLYEMGKISSGQAAKILKMSRIEFLELLGEYKVQIYPDDEKELLKDIANA